MVKVYVLDTNVLVQAPYACECFEENRVVLPLVILEELDNLKKAEGEKAAMPEALFAIWRDYARGGICWRESPPAAEALSGWKKIL